MEILEVNMPIEFDISNGVIERMEKAKIARAQDETLQELELINSRVRHIFEDYELGEAVFGRQSFGSNVEFMSDIKELQSILGDAIQKNKYQQQVTIFIVGFQDSCMQRMELLSQLNEFFDTYTLPMDVEDPEQDSISDIDINAIQTNIQSALHTMDNAVVRLGELNHDIMGYVSSMHSAATSKSNKSRKKLEKNLQLAKDDLLKLTEKLMSTQQNLSTKDEQMQQLRKQLENKAMELINFKTQLEKSRKSHVQLHQDMTRDRFAHEDEIKSMKKSIIVLEQELSKVQDENDASCHARIKEINMAAMNELDEVQEKLTSGEKDRETVLQELSEQYQIQTNQIGMVHQEELENIQEEFRRKVSLMLEIEVSDEDIQQWGKKKAETNDKVVDAIKEEEWEEDKHSQVNESPIKSPESVANDDVSSLSDKADSPIPEIIVTTSLETVHENIDLTDESYWENILEKDLGKKFAEFRAEANKQIHILKAAQDQSTQSADLNQKYLKEKVKWREERDTLLNHIQQLQKLQEEAEADANEAMRQLEELAMQSEHESSKDQGEVLSEEEKPTVTHGAEESSVQPQQEDLKTKDQSTSPLTSKSSVSKKAVADLVEEKRAAMLRRRESASRLLTSSSGSKFNSPNVADLNIISNFIASYKSTIDFRRNFVKILSEYDPFNEVLNDFKDQNVLLSPTETEVELMANTVEETLNTLQEILKASIQTLQSQEKIQPIEKDKGVVDDEYRVSQLEADLQLTRIEFESRSQHDAAIIQHLQNTISTFKQDSTPHNLQVTTNTPSATAPLPLPSGHRLPVSQGLRGHTVDPTMTMMFTRLDSEHNTKALLKSTKIGRINESTLNSLVVTMEEYNNVSGKRLRHLAQKLVHHTKMKEIELNVRNSSLMTAEVFDILDKMESLQRQRAQNWSHRMDELSIKRQRLGLLLQDALFRLEKITGVFLIKPFISYKGKSRLRKYSGKISTRFNRYQMDAMAQKEKQFPFRKISPNVQDANQNFNMKNIHEASPWTAESTQRDENQPLSISGLVRMQDPTMWKIEASLPSTVPGTKREKWSPIYNSLPTTMPRLMELDVNRYLHEINNIHTYKLPGSPEKSPRSGVRTYTGLSRGAVELGKTSSTRVLHSGHGQTFTSESNGDTDYQSTAPPTTPASQTQLHRGSSGADLQSPSSSSIPGASPSLPKPLPPIQGPSRSRTSTRTSFSASPLKEFATPSPTKSITAEHVSPLIRSKGEILNQETALSNEG